MNYFKILIYQLSHIIPDVKYSVLFRYRDTLFCYFSASASFKNMEVILSYLLPVSKSCPDGYDCQHFSNCHCTSSDTFV